MASVQAMLAGREAFCRKAGREEREGTEEGREGERES